MSGVGGPAQVIRCFRVITLAPVRHAEVVPHFGDAGHRLQAADGRVVCPVLYLRRRLLERLCAAGGAVGIFYRVFHAAQGREIVEQHGVGCAFVDRPQRVFAAGDVRMVIERVKDAVAVVERRGLDQVP